MDRSRLKADLTLAESRSNKAYKDSEGLWTGGIGHLLPDQHRDWTGVVFSDAQVDQWFEDDVSHAIWEASQTLEWQYLDTDARQNALCELIFNLGLARWKLFAHCRYAITKKDWPTAHDQLLDSKWAGQVKATRANRLANYLLTGEFA